jgi:hypothetical protein
VKARRRRRRRRLERRRARARPRVGDPRGKKVCQRGTYPTRIPPAVRRDGGASPRRGRRGRRGQGRLGGDGGGTRARTRGRTPRRLRDPNPARRDARASRAKTSFRLFRAPSRGSRVWNQPGSRNPRSWVRFLRDARKRLRRLTSLLPPLTSNASPGRAT